VITGILWRRFVRKDLVEAHIVAGYAVVVALERIVDYQLVGIAQIAQQGNDRDIDHVIAEPAPVGPSAGNEASILKRILNTALENIATEDAQSRVSRIVRIGRIASAVARKANARSRQVDLDHIRDED